MNSNTFSKPFDDDIQRLKHVYRKRETSGEFWDHNSWGLLSPYVEFSEGHFRAEALEALRCADRNQSDFTNLQVLEIGCGWGRNLCFFNELGVPAKNLYGIDLMEHFIEHGKALYPHFQLATENALDYKPGRQYDVVLLHTCLSAIIDETIQTQIIHKAQSWLAPGGQLLIYDVLPKYNPGITSDNVPFIRGVNPSLIKGLLPSNFEISIQTIGLVPRIRHLAFVGPWQILLRKLKIKIVGYPTRISRWRKFILHFYTLFRPFHGYFFLSARKPQDL